MPLRVDVVRYTVDGDRIIAVSAKRSLSRRDFDVQMEKMSDEEVNVWIKETFKRQHFSPWEHSVYTWTVEGCSRVCSHQLVRHRIASFTQLSMRYSKLGFDSKCRIPSDTECIEVCPLENKCIKACREESRVHIESGGSSATIIIEGTEAIVKEYNTSDDPVDNALLNSWLIDAADSYPVDRLDGMKVPVENVFRRACRMIDIVVPPSLRYKPELLSSFIEETSRLFLFYRYMIKNGVPAEDARFIVPMGVETKLVVTMNARELIQSFLPLRMCTKAQWEIRLVAWLLWDKLRRIHPRLFSFAGPRCLFYENAVRPEPLPLSELLSGKPYLVLERCPENIERESVISCVRSNLYFLKRMGYELKPY